MNPPSLSLSPVAPVWDAFSDPAKSTKFRCETVTATSDPSPSVCSLDSIIWNTMNVSWWVYIVL